MDAPLSLEFGDCDLDENVLSSHNQGTYIIFYNVILTQNYCTLLYLTLYCYVFIVKVKYTRHLRALVSLSLSPS